MTIYQLAMHSCVSIHVRTASPSTRLDTITFELHRQIAGTHARCQRVNYATASSRVEYMRFDRMFTDIAKLVSKTNRIDSLQIVCLVSFHFTYVSISVTSLVCPKEAEKFVIYKCSNARTYRIIEFLTIFHSHLEMRKCCAIAVPWTWTTCNSKRGKNGICVKWLGVRLFTSKRNFQECKASSINTPITSHHSNRTRSLNSIAWISTVRHPWSRLVYGEMGK